MWKDTYELSEIRQKPSLHALLLSHNPSLTNWCHRAMCRKWVVEKVESWLPPCSGQREMSSVHDWRGCAADRGEIKWLLSLMKWQYHRLTQGDEEGGLVAWCHSLKTLSSRSSLPAEAIALTILSQSCHNPVTHAPCAASPKTLITLSRLGLVCGCCECQHRDNNDRFHTGLVWTTSPHIRRELPQYRQTDESKRSKQGLHAGGPGENVTCTWLERLEKLLSPTYFVS